jgi:hypothetical protein
MSDHYRTRLTLLDKQLSPEQGRAADTELETWGRETRGALSLRLSEDLYFCAFSKGTLGKQSSAGFTSEAQTYRESDDLPTQAKAVAAMAKIAAEVDVLEIKPD